MGRRRPRREFPPHAVLLVPELAQHGRDDLPVRGPEIALVGAVMEATPTLTVGPVTADAHA
ncbi:MAG TPA: hypothetical protein VMA97_07830 [Streptosporangiaceae bacterium]|nr:hypothetical protein [Streptosporangiaceae bacterium]